MKLHELDALKQQDKAAQVLEQRLGQSVSFDNLTLRESRHMLMRVRGLINEHRASAKFHSSETDPAYLKLIMIESGLKGRLHEAAVTPAPVAGQATPAANPANMAMDMAAKKKQAQDAVKQLDDQIRSLTQQKTQMMKQANNPMAENRSRRLAESEIQQAQVVLAAQDMVDQVQKMLEQISAMQFKDLPALTDSIKNDMGVDQATAYQSAAAAALTQLLASVQQGKTALEGAQGTLTGTAPIVPGAEPAADMGADLNAEPAADIDVDVDAEVAPTDDEEEPTPLGGAGLGRERRDVAEAAKPDYIDLDKDGNRKESMKKAAADKKKNPFAKKTK
jgi:regulator of replication initiation timing